MLKSLPRFCLASSLLACAASAVSAPLAQVSPPKMLTPQAAAFLQAIDDNNIALVKQDLKVDPALANLPPTYDDTSGVSTNPPLSEAAGSAPSFFDDTQVTRLLLQAGAKVNAEDRGGETALQKSAFAGGKKEVTLLLAHGATLEHRDDAGRTALHGAIEGDSVDAVAVLLAHGANVNARDNQGRTPLAYALDPSHRDKVEHAAILNLLRRYGARK